MSRLALRVLTAIWALWFGAALIEPALETCPMHGAHAGHAMSMPGHSASHSGGSKHDAPGPHNCTCLGACCCAPSVAVPSAQVAELTEAVVVDAAAPLLVREHQAPVAAPRYAHPFANGPPALANA